MAIAGRFHIAVAASAVRGVVLGLAWLSCVARCSSTPAPHFSGDFLPLRGRFLANTAPSTRFLADTAPSTPTAQSQDAPSTPTAQSQDTPSTPTAPSPGTSSTPTAPSQDTPTAPSPGTSSTPTAPSPGTPSTPTAPSQGTSSTPTAPSPGTSSTPTPPSPGTSSTPTAPSEGTPSAPSPSAPATPSTASTPTTPGTKVFDITTYGAKSDGKKINTQAFMKAWVEACHSGGPAKVVFPPGKFLTGPLVYAGPCDAPMTVEIQGTVLATTDITEYSSPVWILFESITGLNLIGNGTFDGQGQETWMYNDCRDNPSCIMPPTSLKFNKVTNGLMEGISSLNSKGFHIFLVLSHHLRVNNLNIIAPDQSPNTDGIHISQTDNVTITSSIIGTGDDCVSIGHGSVNVTVSNIKCGPGHGISVGSLGKYKDEKDVSGIFVSNCTLKNTTFGVRIKTWADSPPSQATGIHFQDIVLDSVKSPIIIDQFYGSKKNKKPSKVKISDVSYKNIRGTTISVVPVSLQCSSAVPCDGITLEDIDLAFIGSDRKKALVGNSCLNAKFKATGKQNPPACA